MKEETVLFICIVAALIGGIFIGASGAFSSGEEFQQAVSICQNANQKLQKLYFDGDVLCTGGIRSEVKQK